MHRSATRPRAGRWRRLALAVVGAATALAVLAPAGQANFTTGKCQGSNITGRGASFANTAHAAWKTDFESNCCADVGTFPTVTYEPQGSGAGRRVMGERTAPNADGSPEPQPGAALRHDRRAADADGHQPDEPGHRRRRRRGHDPRDPRRGRLGRAGGQLPRQLRPLAAAGLGRDQPGGGQRGAVHRPRAVHAHAVRGDLERRRRPRPVDRDLPDARRRRGLQRRSSRASCGSTTRARRSRSRSGSTRSTRPATGTRASRPAPTRATGRTPRCGRAPDCDRRRPDGAAGHAPDQRLRQRQRPADGEAARHRRRHRLLATSPPRARTATRSCRSRAGRLA